MFPDVPAEEFAAALDACAADILWEAGVAKPPICATTVARELGLIVLPDETSSHRGRYVRLADNSCGSTGQGTIVVGPAERPEREQWAIAHEIGESVAFRVFAAIGVRAGAVPAEAREQVANHLASCLLLPRDWFLRDGNAHNWDLAALKARYATTSHELIARRMLEMPPPVVITVCDQGTVHWRRSNQPGRPPRLLPGEVEAWRQAHESGKHASASLESSVSGLERVCAWPIHEPGWKREILRSQIAEW